MTNVLCRTLLAFALALPALPALAHGVAAQDAAAVAASSGAQPWVYAYLGAKHMVTGVDHLLFLLGVVFLLQRVRDVAVYATLFACGHSVTLLAGVAFGWRPDEHAVDAVIGLSIVYKALDNLSAFDTFFGRRPPPRLSVAAFGLVHGLGLAGRLQALALPEDGLLVNLLAFNAGVEAGQLLALGLLAAGLAAWRRGDAVPRFAHAVQLALLGAGLLLTFEQLSALAFTA